VWEWFASGSIQPSPTISSDGFGDYTQGVTRTPYVRCLGIREGVAIWLVDGHFIRDRRDVEFTNGAHHFSRAYVPLHEVWVDREAPGAGELEFFVQHQLVERALMQQGLAYEDALRRASLAERRLRRESGVALVPAGVAAARVQVRRRPLRTPRALQQFVRDAIWLVSGRGVRDLFHPDFNQGGHGLRYRFIPRREIWIDDALHAAERDPVIVHEAVELSLMRRGASYDDAHRQASAVEATVRAGGEILGAIAG